MNIGPYALLSHPALLQLLPEDKGRGERQVGTASAVGVIVRDEERWAKTKEREKRLKMASAAAPWRQK